VYDHNNIQEEGTIPIVAIVLLAGTSSRMGGPNKLLLPWGRESIIMFKTLERIISAGPSQVIAVTGRDASIIQLLCNRYFPEVQVVNNPDFELGMTTSIQCGVSNVYKDTKGFMICLGDMPGISSTTYQKLMQHHIISYEQNSNIITIPNVGDQSGHPKILSDTYRDLILTHKELDGCKNLVKQNKRHHNYVEIKDQGCIDDIDTINDLSDLYDKFDV
jgi:molybdenum cofactor cytidylyltransferase